jgi:Zn-finger nucleic acid-binding protein
MKCPRCENTALDEREREGITVDACGGCRGLWLDRGELEKLIARATREIEELSDGRDRRDRDRDDRSYDRDSRKHRKRSFLDVLGDAFD